MLVNSGALIDETDANGITALNYAAMSGHLEIVKFLVESGADTSRKDKLGYTPYYSAVLFGDFKGFTMPPHDKIRNYLKQFDGSTW